jgi:hypothetical protein
VLGITPDIQAEEADVFEIEIGQLIGSRSMLQFNLFSKELQDVISFDDTAVAFANGEKIHTQGFEVEYRYQDDWGFVNANLSHHRVVESTIAEYNAFEYDAVNDTLTQLDQLLGAAEFKAVLYGQLRLTPTISLNSSLIYLGNRQSIGFVPERGIGTYKKVDGDLLTNISIRYQSLRNPSFDASLGVYNATNSDNIVTAGLLGDSTPHAAGIGRRISARLALSF